MEQSNGLVLTLSLDDYASSVEHKLAQEAYEAVDIPAAAQLQIDWVLRTFQWLTVLWAATFLLKGFVQSWLWLINEPTLLGIARLAMGYPPYLLMLGVTVWAVRRVIAADPVPGTSAVDRPAVDPVGEADPRGAEAAS